MGLLLGSCVWWGGGNGDRCSSIEGSSDPSLVLVRSPRESLVVMCVVKLHSGGKEEN